MAGKITGPGGAPPGGAPPGGIPVARNDESPPAAESRPSFSEKLKSARTPTSTAGRESPDATANVTTEVPARLQASTVSPQSAVARVIDRVVDNQLGTNAPAAVRDKVRAALEDAVADDPLLASKIRGLG